MDRKITFTLLYILLFPALILLLSGDFAWPEGWIFSLWILLLCYSVILYLYRKDPALVLEEYPRHGIRNREGFDKCVSYSLLIGFMIWITIMPLDAKWFGLSPAFPAWLKVTGGAGLIVSAFLFIRSYADNTFPARPGGDGSGQNTQVVSRGVYRYIRHPMYLGAVLMFFSAPLLLGSVGGVLVGCTLTILLMARILGEEARLSKELDGYRDYMQYVRYRLIPFVW